MSDVTRILEQIEVGDELAAEQLLPLVYNELRKLAVAQIVRSALDRRCKRPPSCTRRTFAWWTSNSPSSGRVGATSLKRRPRRCARILIERAPGNTGRSGGDWHRVDFENLDAATSVTPDQFVGA